MSESVLHKCKIYIFYSEIDKEDLHRTHLFVPFLIALLLVIHSRTFFYERKKNRNSVTESQWVELLLLSKVPVVGVAMPSAFKRIPLQTDLEQFHCASGMVSRVVWIDFCAAAQVHSFI